MKKRILSIISIFFILVLFFGCIESPDTSEENNKKVISSWSGSFTCNSPNDGTIVNLKLYDDNTMSGRWELTYQGADNLFFTSNGTYTISTNPNGGTQIDFSASGTATKDDLSPTTSSYTLTGTGTITASRASGSAELAFDEISWQRQFQTNPVQLTWIFNIN